MFIIRSCFILFFVFSFLSFSQEKAKTESFDSVDSVPVYPGCLTEPEENRRNCFQEKMFRHVASNFRYPKLAQKEGVQGRVFVQFIVGTEGYVEQIRTRGPDPMLEAEAKRIISLIPRITPGKIDGKAVKVAFSMPVTFKLLKKNPD